LDVTLDNLEEYVTLAVQFFLFDGVKNQLEAFRSGFNSVFPLQNLRIFTVEELETLLCGTNDGTTSTHGYWDLATLIENTKCDHGYNHNSAAVKYLLEIMSDFTPQEQRQFLLFVTGSPRLPAGGFRSLEPKLTIVRKDPDKQHPDTYLPSVNCCFYYLKLPEYSSKAVLKEKLMFAIQHGQGAFSFN
jgi:E3 ubiquitin-protein ligase TRIP12